MIFRLPLLHLFSFSSRPTFAISGPYFYVNPPLLSHFRTLLRTLLCTFSINKMAPVVGNALQRINLRCSRHPSPYPFHRVRPHPMHARCPSPFPAPDLWAPELWYPRSTSAAVTNAPGTFFKRLSDLYCIVMARFQVLFTKMPPPSPFCRYLHWANTRCTRLDAPSTRVRRYILVVLCKNWSDQDRSDHARRFISVDFPTLLHKRRSDFVLRFRSVPVAVIPPQRTLRRYANAITEQ
ncbi:hypothetical protein BJV77DRAFT_643881 [Russula vinacea]|nr:hypothetical protein BJV77DRAFT_643881 [Russula vinacea]